MIRFEAQMTKEDGSVLILAGIVLPLLLVLTAGGVAGFSLLGAHRELQRAADQAATAVAAAIPPVDPGVLAESAPFPLPATDAVYDLAEEAGVDAPRMGEVAPDPRMVGCAYAAEGLSSDSSRLAAAFEEPGGFTPPRSTVCEDERLYPALQRNPDTSSPVGCANRLVRQIASDRPRIQALINPLVRLPLDRLLPAAFTPNAHMQVLSHQAPPLLSLIKDADGNPLGSRTIQAEATAYRRIKNAVVVPIVPEQQAQIELGLTDPISVMTDPVNLNDALRQQQAPLISAIHNVDSSLDSTMGTLGLPCRHMLHNLEQDLRDIYDPPSGPAPSALDIVDAAVTAQGRAASRIGAARPDPSDPTSLAGEAFYLIGVSTGPLSALQIPILDAALVVMNEQADGDYRASLVSAANARGVFRATLVD